jgi:hypothetical protein
MTTLPTHPIPLQEGKLLRLAAEIAMEINPIGDILRGQGVTDEEWGRIQTHPRFQMLLLDAVREWNKATNTPERVKVKSATMLEQALPDMYGRIVDNKESLAAKTELLKLIAKLAGIGDSKGEVVSPEKFVLNINIGDSTRTIGVASAKVIEHQS